MLPHSIHLRGTTGGMLSQDATLTTSKLSKIMLRTARAARHRSQSTGLSIHNAKIRRCSHCEWTEAGKAESIPPGIHLPYQPLATRVSRDSWQSADEQVFFAKTAPSVETQNIAGFKPAVKRRRNDSTRAEFAGKGRRSDFDAKRPAGAWW